MSGRRRIPWWEAKLTYSGNNLINEARFGYMETREVQQVPGTNLDAQYGIQGAPDYPEVHGLPTFAISGLNTLGTTGPGSLPLSTTGSGNLPLDKQGRNIQFLDNLSWVKGRHTLKFGLDVEQVTLYGHVTLSARPAFDFHGRLYAESAKPRRARGRRSRTSCWATSMITRYPRGRITKAANIHSRATSRTTGKCLPS